MKVNIFVVVVVAWFLLFLFFGLEAGGKYTPCDAGYRINMAGHTVCNPVGTDGLPVRGPAGY